MKEIDHPDLLARIQKEYQRLLEALPDSRSSDPASRPIREARDTLAHLTAWETFTLVRLDAAKSGAVPQIPPIGSDAEIDRLNARIQAEAQFLSYPDIVQEYVTRHAELVATIEQYDGAFLGSDLPESWGRGRKVWELIAANTFRHYPEHIERMEKVADENIMVRLEAPADAAAVFHVNESAFGRPDEARLVERLRSTDTTLLSLVAEVNGRVVGHVLFTTVELKSENGASAGGAALGPVAVLPDHQRQGIGDALIRDGLEMLRQMGQPFCVVLGHSSYYPRFGFQPTDLFGIRCQWDVPPEVFMALALRPDGLEGKTGTVMYAEAFQDV